MHVALGPKAWVTCTYAVGHLRQAQQLYHVHVLVYKPGYALQCIGDTLHCTASCEVACIGSEHIHRSVLVDGLHMPESSERLELCFSFHAGVSTCREGLQNRAVLHIQTKWHAKAATIGEFLCGPQFLGCRSSACLPLTCSSCSPRRRPGARLSGRASRRL